MLDQFVRLTDAAGNILYIKPEDIELMSYDEVNQLTMIYSYKIPCVYNQMAKVKETPGVICDLCDKCRAKQEEQRRRSY